MSASLRQHLAEINQTKDLLDPDLQRPIHFIPYRGDFARGIIASVWFTCDKTEEEVKEIYRNCYKDEPFTHFYEGNLYLKQVVNTNKCIVALEKHGDTLVISSVIDNLLKGASGQAVQNMNLICGLPETTGLKLKASAF